MIYALNDNYFVRVLDENDLEGNYPDWFSDQEVCRYNSHGKFVKTKEYYRTYLSSLNDETHIVWAICHTQDGHVGNISLQEISFINRTAELAIMLGDRRHWGKSLGLLAGRALLSHGFNKLNLVRVYCGTSANNYGMIKLALALGMIQEGIRREHLYLDGHRHDMLEYGVLKSEFVKVS